MPNRTIIGNSDHVFGTCELGNAWGEVEQASLQRVADEEGIEDCGGAFLAYLLTNPRYELEFTALFPTTVTLPDFGASITFPVPGENIVGQALGWTVEWEKKGTRKLKIRATHWDSLGNSPTVTDQTYSAAPGED